MSVAVLFQEYHTGRYMYEYETKKQWALIRFIWAFASMFVVMAFLGNLEASFVKQNYEERTLTLVEMVDKDMTIYLSTEMAEYFEQTKENSYINRRILEQAKKKKSLFSNRYYLKYFVLLALKNILFIDKNKNLNTRM